MWNWTKQSQIETKKVKLCYDPDAAECVRVYPPSPIPLEMNKTSTLKRQFFFPRCSTKKKKSLPGFVCSEWSMTPDILDLIKYSKINLGSLN